MYEAISMPLIKISISLNILWITAFKLHTNDESFWLT